MSSVVFGRDMVFEAKIDDVYTPVGCAVSGSFQFTNELIAKTDVNAGLFRKRRVRISDCSLSVQGLTTLENNATASVMYFLLEAVRRTDQDLRITFTDEDGLQKQIQGLFLMESAQLNGEVAGFSEFDMEFQGNGGFTISDMVDESGEGLPGEVNWDWWEGVEGENTISGPGNYGRSFSGDDILLVDREGVQYDEVAIGPVGRQYSTNGTILSFDPDLPFNPGERVFVLWENA
jgi:hypothetical protein